nr:NADH dehydrogenase subunit 5 [Noterus clavicornis]
MNKISICKIYFFSLLIFSLFLFICSLLFMSLDYVLFLEFELFSLNSLSLVMSVLLDWMSLLFMSFVLYISSMVINYSKEYMMGDLNINRFIILVLLFVLSMIFLIISPNLLSILLGWDGLGLVSYCLVVYYQNEKSYNAGMLTIMMNRVGDVMMLLSISWMLNYGSFNYIFYLESMKMDFNMMLISLLIFIASMTKSAQIPFSSWLPAAMAAPTPVSALVHSSTLVTAGVYLMIRFSVVFSDLMLMILLFISVCTMFMSGIVANFEFDLKKIIALSTLSQLGLMMSILSLGYFKLAFFHLLTHAMFKALLFMCAGSIIHSFLNNQDIRFMGGLIINMPLTCICMNISNLALCGMPFLAGFYSKDLILEVVSMSFINLFMFILFFLSTGLTVSYSLRLCYYSISGSYNFFSFHNLMDNMNLIKSKIPMLMMVIISGSMLMWLMFPSPSFICLSLEIKLLPLLVCLLGGWLGYEIYNFSLNLNNMFLMNYKLTYYLGSMWFIPNISVNLFNIYFLNFGYMIYKSFDQGWSEELEGQGMYKLLKKNSMINQFFYLNNLKIYIIFMFIWFMLMMMMMI